MTVSESWQAFQRSRTASADARRRWDACREIFGQDDQKTVAARIEFRESVAACDKAHEAYIYTQKHSIDAVFRHVDIVWD